LVDADAMSFLPARGAQDERFASASATMTRVLHLPINRAGRDFVVGDIHGCYSLLDDGLRAVGFDPGCDRLFALGDLIDRGPESDLTARFLRRPGIHSILGNHEAIVLDLYEDGPPGPDLIEDAPHRGRGEP
jgi:hypothetical protein